MRKLRYSFTYQSASSSSSSSSSSSRSSICGDFERNSFRLMHFFMPILWEEFELVLKTEALCGQGCALKQTSSTSSFSFGLGNSSSIKRNSFGWNLYYRSVRLTGWSGTYLDCSDFVSVQEKLTFVLVELTCR